MVPVVLILLFVDAGAGVEFGSEVAESAGPGFASSVIVFVSSESEGFCEAFNVLSFALLQWVFLKIYTIRWNYGFVWGNK
jgi:hypothetical protein